MSSFEQGREFEKHVAKVLGADLTPGSGNTPWLKLDLTDADRLLVSCKWTGQPTFMLRPRLFDEIDRAVHAPGGVGGNTVGALACTVGGGGRALIVMDLVDFARMLQEGVTIGRQTRSEARVERSRKPVLFRDEGGEQ